MEGDRMTTRKQRKSARNRYAKRVAQAKAKTRKAARHVANILLGQTPVIFQGAYHYRTTFVMNPRRLGVITGITSND